MKAVPGVAIPTPDVEWAWEFCMPNLLISTFGLFLVFSCIRQKKAPALVTGIAKRSYGMYLMHMLYLIPISMLVIGSDTANPAVPIWIAIPLIAILTYLCCALTAKLISLIPGSKWIIG